MAIFVTYVNSFFLLDLTALAFSLDFVRRDRRALRSLFASVGDLDAAVAVASFRAGAPGYSRPEIAPEATALELEDVVHPLLEHAVPNSIHVAGRGVLVTGANMSGKSTLVRAVALNALLAQTIYTTLARRYRAPLLRVRTLMSAIDDVQRSRSYYYAELEGAKALLEPSAEGTRTLVVLDELFRGTNTDERIGAGKAVLEALRDAGHIVFASTHDRELVGLLREGFDPYHFGEDVAGGELVFDYTLRAGPRATRNAIALLELVGFPREVVADATKIVEELDRGQRAVGGPGRVSARCRRAPTARASDVGAAVDEGAALADGRATRSEGSEGSSARFGRRTISIRRFSRLPPSDEFSRAGSYSL